MSSGLGRAAAVLALAGGAALRPGPAGGAHYECTVEIGNRDDLDRLLALGLLGAESHAALAGLLDDPVDLRRDGGDRLRALPNVGPDAVDVLLALRRRGRDAAHPDTLAEAGIGAAVLETWRPFLRPPARRRAVRTARAASARVRLLAAELQGDGRPPGLGSTAATWTGAWQAGATLRLTQGRPGALRSDPAGLLADAPAPRVHPAHYHVTLDGAAGRAVAGTFRATLALPLVFDADGPGGGGVAPEARLRPDLSTRSGCVGSGAACAGGRVARDVEAPGALRGLGLAGTWPLARGRLQALLLASWAGRDVYQYQLREPGRCPAGAPCPAPPVRVAGQPGSTFRFQTLTHALDEGLLGASLAWQAPDGARVAAAAYGATVRWRAPGLDFQPQAPRPAGGPWGAAGGGADLPLGPLRLSVSGARTLDAGGGGHGLVARAGLALRPLEVEATAWRYDAGFANPYARAPAAPDRVGGTAARDESGLRLQAGAGVGGCRLGLRGAAWTHPVGGGRGLELRAGGDCRWGPARVGAHARGRRALPGEAPPRPPADSGQVGLRGGYRGRRLALLGTAALARPAGGAPPLLRLQADLAWRLPPRLTVAASAGWRAEDLDAAAPAGGIGPGALSAAVTGRLALGRGFAVNLGLRRRPEPDGSLSTWWTGELAWER